MSKNLGYTNRLASHWTVTGAYGTKEISAIADPDGGNGIILPTAIPSPFARIDLVKNAFENIILSKDLKALAHNNSVIASREDEKLVSDCLDLAELLFNHDSVPNLEIVFWDRKAQIQALKTSGNISHKRLAETMEMFLTQDANTYNFNELDGFYLIKHNHKVIGGTSPVSMFFTSGNDLTSAQISLTGNDILFDNNYAPLYERDADFQKYLYLLFEANLTLKTKLKCFWDYLQENEKVLEQKNINLFKEIKSLNINSFNADYSDLCAGANSFVQLFGVVLKQRKVGNIIDFVKDNSDFRIKSTKYTEDLSPLVLANNCTNDWQYAKDKWNKTFVIPANDNTDFTKRNLPGINLAYPYLAIDDFLEPYLVQMPYPLDNESYFDGNLKQIKGGENKSYLLPLKPLFFRFFNAEDLYANEAESPKLEITQSIANSVIVSLKIPVSKQGQFITFDRTYQYNVITNKIEPADLEQNQGQIIPHTFSIALFPFIKANTPDVEAFYRVQLIDLDNAGIIKQSKYALTFYNNIRKVEQIDTKRRLDNKELAVTEYSVLNKEFDYIQINTGFAQGIVIPKWQAPKQGADDFTFAVDFGTSNTHIEYKVGNSNPQAFCIGEKDKQIASLVKSDYELIGKLTYLDTYISTEFIPYKIGNPSEFKFPLRTGITNTIGISSATKTYTLANFNIGFAYFIKTEVTENTVTNLKWSKQGELNTKRIEAFVESIIILMRNKVLLNGGNLAKTKLVWFYPSSMNVARLGKLDELWNGYFNKYFNPHNESKGLMESLAPFYYFKGIGGKDGIAGVSEPVATIDIGGGTTDVVVFEKGAPVCVTSFMFASNNLFGNGYVDYGKALDNGFINKYLEQYEKKIKETGNGNLRGILEKLKETSTAEEINNFLLTIDANKNNIKGYAETLADDDDIKIGFLYYFSAIIFHVASLMKSKGVVNPKYILFSGTGSKVLNIIASKDDTLSKLTTSIFEKVYNQSFEKGAITVKRNKDIPKELTCKGGLMASEVDLNIDTQELKTIFSPLVKNKITYGELDENILNLVLTEVHSFNNMFIELAKDLKFVDLFGASKESIDEFENVINENLTDYLNNGISFHKALDNARDTDELKETMFFYPITGALQNLISKLSTLNPIAE